MKNAPKAMTRNKAGLAALTTWKTGEQDNRTFPIKYLLAESLRI